MDRKISNVNEDSTMFLWDKSSSMKLAITREIDCEIEVSFVSSILIYTLADYMRNYTNGDITF